VAEAVLPGPPVEEVTLTESVAEEAAVTLTETVHDEFTGTEPPARVITDEPAAETSVPPQVFVTLGVEATLIPGGSALLKPTPARATELAAGLAIVTVREVDAFAATLDAPKAREMVGGAATAIVAAAEVFCPASVDMAQVFVFDPADVPVTFTEKLQDAEAARVAPESAMLPLEAVMVPPPQEPVSPFGLATARPAGRVSVRLTPVILELPLLLLTVKVRLVEPFSGIVSAPKASDTDGPATPVMVSD
jgi:hypothetical protein